MASKTGRAGGGIAYTTVRGSDGPRREFKITLGLRAGYGPAGRIYDIEEAVRSAHAWMVARARADKTFLTGMFTRGEVLYARRLPSHANREPVAIFSGEALPQAARKLDDAMIEEMLNELAIQMARKLEQEEVQVAYRGRTWTLRRAKGR